MSSSQQTERPILVIGGGIGGLACAVALCDAGFPVRLVEAANMFGGRARSCFDPDSGDTVDIGPHVLTSEHRNMLALLARLGTAKQVVWQREKFITLLDNGKAIDMRMYRLPAPFHFLPNFFRVSSLSFADIHSARQVLLHVMSMNETDVLRHDSSSAESVLREMGVSEKFIDWFWRTVCMAILNVPLEQCSAGSLLRFLKMMAMRSDFHFGFPAVPLADLHVPAAVALIRRSGGQAELSRPVKTLHVEQDVVRGAVMADGSLVEASACVLALPPQALSAVLPLQLVELRESLAGFLPSPYVSSYLWFTKKLTAERFWARIWSPRNVNYDFYDLSNIRPSWRRRGSVIAANSIFSETIGKLDDSQVIDATLRELNEFLPGALRSNLQHARVHRIPMAIPAPRPGFETLRPAVRTPVAGLYLAGDWVQTALPASMESAVRAGFLAAEAVAEDRGKILHVALPQRRMQGLAGWWWRRKNRERGN